MSILKPSPDLRDVRRRLPIEVVLCLLLFGIGSAAVAQQAPNEAVRFQWQQARNRFQAAGDLIGERRFTEARTMLQNVVRDFRAPYREMAERPLPKLVRHVYGSGSAETRATNHIVFARAESRSGHR